MRGNTLEKPVGRVFLDTSSLDARSVDRNGQVRFGRCKIGLRAHRAVRRMRVLRSTACMRARDRQLPQPDNAAPKRLAEHRMRKANAIPARSHRQVRSRETTASRHGTAVRAHHHARWINRHRPLGARRHPVLRESAYRNRARQHCARRSRQRPCAARLAEMQTGCRNAPARCRWPRFRADPDSGRGNAAAAASRLRQPGN